MCDFDRDGAWGRRHAKKPSLRSSKAPSRCCTHTPVRDNRRSSRRNKPPRLVFLPPSGVGKKKFLSCLKRCPACAPASVQEFFSCLVSLDVSSPTHARSRCCRPYPSPVAYVVRGAPIQEVCRYDKLRHTALGNLSIIRYQPGEGSIEHKDRVAAPQKTVGTKVYISRYVDMPISR
jgi:hypothetical protein